MQILPVHFIHTKKMIPHFLCMRTVPKLVNSKASAYIELQYIDIHNIYTHASTPYYAFFYEYSNSTNVVIQSIIDITVCHRIYAILRFIKL